MKDWFDKVSFTTVVIVYLFVCGGLYIIGYWGEFFLDITPFISIADIPKSFILPFKNSGLVLILLIHSTLYAITFTFFYKNRLVYCFSTILSVSFFTFQGNNYSFHFSSTSTAYLIASFIISILAVFIG